MAPPLEYNSDIHAGALRASASSTGSILRAIYIQNITIIKNLPEAAESDVVLQSCRAGNSLHSLLYTQAIPR
jgi:hypothetical protein